MTPLSSMAAPPAGARASLRAALCGLLAAACAAPAGAAGPGPDAATLATRSLAASCAACHGTDGHAAAPDGAMAALAGRDAATTAAQLRAFRDGTRPATVMHQLAKGYSDAQLQALAAYFAAQR